MNYTGKFKRFVMPLLLLLFLSALASPLANVRLKAHTAVTCSLQACHTTSNACSKPTVKSQEKSVLDAEALESPITFFKDMMSTEADSEDDRAAAAPAAPLVIAVKGLVATLLSTII